MAMSRTPAKFRKLLDAINTKHGIGLKLPPDEFLPMGIPWADRKALIGAILDELAATGLNAVDSPNPRGLKLEALIDWLGPPPR
jgi:hypothetical protein